MQRCRGVDNKLEIPKTYTFHPTIFILPFTPTEYLLYIGRTDLYIGVQRRSDTALIPLTKLGGKRRTLKTTAPLTIKSEITYTVRISSCFAKLKLRLLFSVYPVTRWRHTADLPRRRSAFFTIVQLLVGAGSVTIFVFRFVPLIERRPSQQGSLSTPADRLRYLNESAPGSSVRGNSVGKEARQAALST